MPNLNSLIRDEITQKGAMPVSRYMELVLAHPEYGYYMRRDPFGVNGDFITAPEISQMFGEMIGLWSAVVWQGMGAPEPLEWVELGPGRGTLMSDALRAAAAMEAFDDAARIHFVETSPALREIQNTTMSQMLRKPAWHDTFDTVPENPAIIIANEFFDALPIEQFIKTDDGWHMRCVGLSDTGEGLQFIIGPHLEDLSLIPQALRDVPAGALFEAAPARTAVMAAIAAHVVKHGGAALVMDYGHVESGIGDTLQALKAHEYFDVLETPGEADVTSHVDFQALADIAEAAGAEVSGPVPQGAFLARLGMRERADQLMLHAQGDQLAEIEAATQRLTDSEQMGTLFKVMAIARPGLKLPPWSG